MLDEIHVIGSGVIGLGVAIRFAEEGHPVQVFSDNDQLYSTSPIAAAFWYPYACSMTEQQESLLALPTLKYLAFNSSELNCGIEFRNGREYFGINVSDKQIERPWWAAHDVNFEELTQDAIPERVRSNTIIGPFVSGWSFRVPVVNMRLFLPWLVARAQRLGVIFTSKRVKSLKQASKGAAVVVNCSGGWATWLTPDPKLVAYQGVVLEVPSEPYGTDLIFVEKGQCDLPTYIVPQGTRTILGGTLVAKTNAGAKWPIGDRTLWEPSESDVLDVVRRCATLVPSGVEIDASTVRLAGLRPGRLDSPPRIEVDRQFDNCVIHNYGHGGSGLTTFWGSADLAYALYQQSMANKPLHTEPRVAQS